MSFGQLLNHTLVGVIIVVALPPTAFYDSVARDNTALQFNGVIEMGLSASKISVDGIVQNPYHLIWRSCDGEGCGINFLECVGQLLVM